MKNKGPLKVLNGTKLNLDDHGNNLESFRINLEFFRSFRGPLRLKPVTGQELFFAVSHNKPALTNFGVHESLKLHNITVGLVQVFTKLHKLKMCFVHVATITVMSVRLWNFKDGVS